VYGIVAQDVVQRTQEIGVRLALGAAPGQVLRLMLRRALRLAALALVVGVPACLAASRLMAGALFGIVRPGPFDLVLYSGGLLALAVVAAWAPARRAAALDPLSALRSG
jgi:putative ABC transport system permease protein